MSKVFEAGRFKGGYSVDDIDSILENAMKIAKEAVAPTNDDGDTIHAVYKNGKVTVPESFKKPIGLSRKTAWVRATPITATPALCLCA